MSTVQAMLAVKRRELESLFSRFSQCLKLAQSYGKSKLTLLKDKKQLADNLRIEVTKLEKEVLLLNAKLSPEESKEALDMSKTISAIDDIVESVTVLYSEAVENSTKQVFANPNPPPAHPDPPQRSGIKLPHITIKPFENTFLDYPRFLKLFNAVYGSHQSLSGCEKFYYLQSCLQGESLSLVNTYPLSDEGYNGALAALKARFGSPRALAASITNELFNFQSAKKASPESLKCFLKTHHDNISTLKSLPEMADLSDFLLLSIALRNLDPLTRKLFESHMQDKSATPTYVNLIDYVTKQLNTLELLSAESNNNENVTNNFSSNSGSNRKSNYHFNNNSSPIPKVYSNRNNQVLAVTNQVPASTQQAPKANKSSHFKPRNGSHVNPNNNCLYCSDSIHSIYKCAKFLALSKSQKDHWVTSQKRCQVCLSTSHSTADCKSSKSCYYCKSTQHNSMWCNEKPTGPVLSVQLAVTNTDADQSSSSQVLACMPASTNVFTHSVNLGSAIALVPTGKGTHRETRFVIDSAAVHNLITLQCVEALGLEIHPEAPSLSGVGQKISGTLGHVDIVLRSPFDTNFKINVKACVMETITEDLKPVNLTPDFRNFLLSLRLADPQMLTNNPTQSRPLEILLALPATLLILSKSIIAPISSTEMDDPYEMSNPFLIHSPFGSIFCGNIPNSIITNCNQPTQPAPKSDLSVVLTCSDCSTVAQEVKNFFDSEAVQDGSQDPVLSSEELLAEEHFVETHSREPDGRFNVRLIFQPDPPNLGSNRLRALACFFGLERKLNSKENYACYQKAMQDFLDKSQIVPSAITQEYILNQHIVIKKSNNKAKIVFNPAVKAPIHSLNSTLLCGPKLQSDLRNVLISFRAHPIAVVCDIDDFYRSISLHPEDAEKLHIFVRLDENGKVSPTGKIRECAIRHLCYGLSCAPFLALRCVNQLCKENELVFPEATHVLRNYRYIDDVCFSSPSIQHCAELKNQLVSILAQGKFSLSKFVSSHPEQLGITSTTAAINFNKDSTTTPVLGCLWDPIRDSFTFNVDKFKECKITRRTCTSYLARCFDSLGYLSPALFYLKRFVQKLWYNFSDLGWDLPLPPEAAQEWLAFTDEMPLLCNLFIPRYCTLPDSKQYLCVFSDASIEGISSAAYIVSVNEQFKNSSHLIYAKTKLAPLKTIRTIPQLELAGIEKSAKIIHWLTNEPTPYMFEQIYCYSDSKIALSYLRIPPSKLKVYTANRVSNIIKLTEKANVQFLFCRSEDNPSDLNSRGIPPSKLLDNQLWFTGPEFLKTNNFPPSENDPDLICDSQLPDIKQPKPVLISSQKTEPNLFYSLTENFSSFSKLQRVMAYVGRFISNCRCRIKQETLAKGPISVPELNSATLFIVKVVQDNFYSKAISGLKRKKSCSKELITLNPFIDLQGLLRVGGRLTHTELPFDSKHPIILPKNCNLSIIICRFYHILAAHGGTNLSVSLLRSRFWIVSARMLMRSVIHKCITCAKWHPVKPNPIQGNLPNFRIENTFPFRATTGIDAFGPYMYKITNRKNSPCAKIWGLIFVCEATRASHLEVLTSMCTNDFLAAVDRFTARRGIPSRFRADRGSNFVSGFKKLSELSEFLIQNSDTIISSLATRSIQFEHIPAYSPWMGASWEATIKCAKRHLNSLLTANLYLHEYMTLFTRVEALLNSRPYLEPTSNAKDDLNLLCPACFLVGGPMFTPPSILPTDNEEQINVKDRWERISNTISLFWKRWNREVLHTLNQRFKWPKHSDFNCQIGQLVWVPDIRTTPGTWPLGRISKLYPDPQSTVRVVDVKTASGILRRSVRNLVLVPT